MKMMVIVLLSLSVNLSVSLTASLRASMGMAFEPLSSHPSSHPSSSTPHNGTFNDIHIPNTSPPCEHPPKVVVSIPPFYTLVAAVMQGVAVPELLIHNGASPHHYSLRPSDMKRLTEANIIFWGGPALETFLNKPLQNLHTSAMSQFIVELVKTPGLLLLPIRQNQHFEPHEHTSEHHHHAESNTPDPAHVHAQQIPENVPVHPQAEPSHVTANLPAHTQKEPANATAHVHVHVHPQKEPSNVTTNVPAHTQQKEPSHVTVNLPVHTQIDMHFWLDPNNAIVLTDAICHHLITIDPKHRDIYQKNAHALKADLQRLQFTLFEKLKIVQGIPFIVFHDAYQYFEHRYKLSGAGAITLHPEVPPSAKRMAHIRTLIQQTKAQCVFTEPQFQPKLVYSITHDLNVKIGELDPIGQPPENNATGYRILLENLTDSLIRCLKGE